MNVSCVICSDQILQFHDVYNTKCGHVFHHLCLKQWLDRSKTCPQCRESVIKTTDIHKLYFTFANAQQSNGNPSSLEDSLKFQLLLKKKDLQFYANKSATLLKQCNLLRKEVQKLESESRQMSEVTHALKEQIKFYKKKYDDLENTKKQVEHLKEKLKNLNSIQILLQSPLNVEELIQGTRDPKKLIQFISVMKKELISNLDKMKQLRISLRRLKEEHSNCSIIHSLAQHANQSESGNSDSRVRKKMLVRKIKELQRQFQILQEKMNNSNLSMHSSISNTHNIQELPEDSFRNESLIVKDQEIIRSNSAEHSRSKRPRLTRVMQKPDDTNLSTNHSQKKKGAIVEHKNKLKTGFKSNDKIIDLT
ncbi:E3 ubiquitin-protein ligase TRAIP-like isoform X2 [Prorops nasuta]|uniref:E3 ubiquitin-protein ligase TRAIP-like isoform X2 n=1 Tax=Prorops nasuta TaxID=863751 RepID=UPI0034CE420F